MLSYKSLIDIDTTLSQSVYLQIANTIIKLIRGGVLKPAAKLPSSRVLAKELNCHRKTVLRAIDELEVQGWVSIIPYKGVYIANDLPNIQHRQLTPPIHTSPEHTGFNFVRSSILTQPLITQHSLGFADGVPDPRLAPINELARAYSQRLKSTPHHMLSYGSTLGTLYARGAVADYLNQGRGLPIDSSNVMLTRGSIMGIYLSAKLILTAGDIVVMGAPDYTTARICFEDIGAVVEHVGVDNDGINIDQIVTKIKSGTKIRMIYVTPHHHYPTTVALSPTRRLQLLELALQYKIAIIEDDYSYDYHYAHAPILPLASADKGGNVIYIGSFSKVIAPTFRVGYIVAPSDFIAELSKHRRIIDRQGDHVLEDAIADLINDGTIVRYQKRTIKEYSRRLDYFCELFDKYNIDDHADYDRPEGGMAAWVTWREDSNIDQLPIYANKYGMYFPNSKYYDPPGQVNRGVRMGFSNLNTDEMSKSFHILTKILRK